MELSEELASCFVQITNEFDPLPDVQPAVTFENPFTVILPHEIATRVRREKKVKSAVDGDLLPSLSNDFSDLTAIPATRILNYALARQIWPDPWLIETQNTIPKSNNASDFDQLRNQSCTNSLSKILESFVLEQIRQEVTISASPNVARTIF